MGTEVLRSHDCLQGRFRHDAFAIAASSSVRSRRNPNCHASCQTRHRKRSPAAVHANFHDRDRSRSVNRSMVEKVPSPNLVMGQVKILKRGEKLSQENSHLGLTVSTENRKARAKIEDGFDLVLGSTDRLGPDPETVQKQVRVSAYAGSAFVASPPPSSVPVPGFLGKNGAATSDLRRLLRLDSKRFEDWQGGGLRTS